MEQPVPGINLIWFLFFSFFLPLSVPSVVRKIEYAFFISQFYYENQGNSNIMFYFDLSFSFAEMSYWSRSIFVYADIEILEVSCINYLSS